MAKEYQIRTLSTGWKLPFNLAILFHVLLLSSAIILPKYIRSSPKLPEFTSVDLVNIADILPLAETSSAKVAPPSKSTPAPAKAIKKPPPPEAVETAAIVPVAEEVSLQPARAISIQPLKRKLKKKLPLNANSHDSQQKREAEERRKLLSRQKALEAKSRELQEEARRQKAIADQEAKIAASEALSALKQSLRADAASAAVKQGAGRNSRSGGSSRALEAQYFSSIFGHLHQYWALPEIKQWDPELTAIVVINIAKNGRIISHNFEKRSGDRVFDQFVSRTIEEANPLPAIPAALKKQNYILGLRFKPGKIQ